MNLDWLNTIATTKEAWVYLLFGVIGLLTSLTWSTTEENRLPALYDFYKLLSWLPFVAGVAILADMSPWLSLVIGVVPERIYKVVRGSGLGISFGPNGLSFNSKKPGDKGDNSHG